MSWPEHYRNEAKKHRMEAHAWSTHGFDDRAELSKAAADVYEELADEAENDGIRPEQR